MDRERKTREVRTVAAMQVTFRRLESEVRGETEDISSSGAFIRTEDLLPVGALVSITFSTGEDKATIVCRVAHLLSPSIAQSLGRSAGMGVQFLETNPQKREAIERLLQRVHDGRNGQVRSTGARVAVFDHNQRLRERVGLSLSQNGYEVNTFDSVESLLLHLRERDVHVLISAVGDDADGWQLLQSCQEDPLLGHMPIICLGDGCTSMERLRAYELGVDDFVPKPFTDAELLIRTERVFDDFQLTPAAMLRGALDEISASTLLSILQAERKSGIVWFTQGQKHVRMFLRDGEPVRAGDPDQEGREVVFDVLAWSEGNFEFNACEVGSEDLIGMNLQQLLLEFARRLDESSDDAAADSDFMLDELRA